MDGMNTLFDCQKDIMVKNVDSLPLAMAYVPWQSWRKIYKAEDALMQGTIFEELNLPFTGRDVRSDVSDGKEKTFILY